MNNGWPVVIEDGGGVALSLAGAALPSSLYSIADAEGPGSFLSPCVKGAASRLTKAQRSVVVVVSSVMAGVVFCPVGLGPLAKTCPAWPQALPCLYQEKGPPYGSSMGGRCSQSRQSGEVLRGGCAGGGVSRSLTVEVPGQWMTAQKNGPTFERQAVVPMR